MIRLFIRFILVILVFLPFPVSSFAWFDDTRLAVTKAAGYDKWYMAVSADMTKVKMGSREGHNHYVNNPNGTVVTPKMVLDQVKKYDQKDPVGHLYGAIVSSVRNYIESTKNGKYGEYHLGFCSHYVGDLSQPLHNTLYNSYNRRYHLTFDGVVNDEVLANLGNIRIYSITINSEQDLAKEIARIANISLELGYRIQDEGRVLTKKEAYEQLSHSVSLFKAILKYAKDQNGG